MNHSIKITLTMIAACCTMLVFTYSALADHHNLESHDNTANTAPLGLMSSDGLDSVDDVGDSIRSVDGTGLRSRSDIESVDGTGRIQENPVVSIRSVDGTGLRSSVDRNAPSASATGGDELRSVDGTGLLQQSAPLDANSNLFNSDGADSDNCAQSTDDTTDNQSNVDSDNCVQGN